MTSEQLEVLRKVDEMLNEVRMPTYSELAKLASDAGDYSESSIKEFRDAVKSGKYTTAHD